MPPELLMQFDKNFADGPELIYEKIDVWSIGCIMLEIFTGIPLWFRYKCKVGNRLDLGIFSLTNRDYSKIVKKQNELC
jgi:serine/threonine protein kinase